jgi:hypothetical protein
MFYAHLPRDVARPESHRPYKTAEYYARTHD